MTQWAFHLTGTVVVAGVGVRGPRQVALPTHSPRGESNGPWDIPKKKWASTLLGLTWAHSVGSRTHGHGVQNTLALSTRGDEKETAYTFPGAAATCPTREKKARRGLPIRADLYTCRLSTRLYVRPLGDYHPTTGRPLGPPALLLLLDSESPTPFCAALPPCSPTSATSGPPPMLKVTLRSS